MVWTIPKDIYKNTFLMIFSKSHKMQHFPSFLLIISLAISLLSGCSGGERKTFTVMPIAYGKVDNIMVVADEYNWTTVVGDTFRNYFEALYPVTPQPESIYDLRHKTPKEFTEATILKTHRAIVLIGALDDMNDGASKLIREALGEKNVEKAKTDSGYRIAVHKDRWAQGQIVVYWFGPDRNELLKTISNDYQQVMDEFNKADTKMFIEQVYLPGQNLEATAKIQQLFQANLKIPKGFVVAHQDSIAMWLRKETDKISSNIFICSLPISDSTQLLAEQHKKTRDKLTKKYFSTHIEGSFMQIDDRVLPIYYQEMVFDGKRTLQARGLWGMVNDFMGGSFVTYMIEDKANNRVLFLDGFIHAPGQKKRPEMRRLDMIFSTFRVS